MTAGDAMTQSDAMTEVTMRLRTEHAVFELMLLEVKSTVLKQQRTDCEGFV